MQITNLHNLPKALVRAVENDPYSSKGSDVSTTRLIGPVQMFVLEKRHSDKLSVDVTERLPALRGQGLHAVLERACPDDSLSEKRYETKVEGWTLSGQIDLIEEETIWDYKDTTVWAWQNGPLEEWIAQGNVNRWLVYKATGKLYDKLKNVLFLKDWKRYEQWKKNYPELGIQIVDLPLWGINETEDYVMKKVQQFQAAITLADNQLPECSKEERWKDDLRCKQFCPVRTKCTQFLNKLEEWQ